MPLSRFQYLGCGLSVRSGGLLIRTNGRKQVQMVKAKNKMGCVQMKQEDCVRMDMRRLVEDGEEFAERKLWIKLTKLLVQQN